MSTDTPTGTRRRTDKLIAARREASRVKTARTLATVARLHTAGEPVTFARVARTANVSTWFTYNNTAVAAAIRQARADQTENGLHETPHPDDRVSAASLRVDLEHARHEVRTLNNQVRHLQHAVGRRLGAELEAVDPADLLTRVRNLEQHNIDLADQLATSEQRRRFAEDELGTTTADLAAARETLRRTIRSVPSPP